MDLGVDGGTRSMDPKSHTYLESDWPWLAFPSRAAPQCTFPSPRGEVKQVLIVLLPVLPPPPLSSPGVSLLLSSSSEFWGLKGSGPCLFSVQDSHYFRISASQS